LLIEALRDKSSYVGKLAADALGERAENNDDVSLALLASYDYFDGAGEKRDPGCDIRTSIVYSLARIEYYPARSIFQRGIRTYQIEAVGGVPTDLGAQLRAAAALAMAQIQERGALIEIAPLLFDTGKNRLDVKPLMQPINAEVRCAAARAIAILGDINGLVPLSIKLKFPKLEPEPNVTAECMLATMALDATTGQLLVEPYLQCNDPMLIASAAVALAKYADSDAMLLVTDAIHRLHGREMRAVTLTLASLRTANTVGALYDLASSEREDERLAFIEAIQVTRDVQALPLITTLASGDPSAKNRKLATAVLNDLSVQSTVAK
jgi:hypothetical protein